MQPNFTRTRNIAIAIIAIAGLAAVSEAGQRARRDPGVNQRQSNQRQRIQQGVRSGQLTGQEVRDLAGEQREIRQQEREYKSDGVLTRDERQDLHQDLKEASQNIYEEKHDTDQRPRVNWSTTRDPGVNTRQAIQHHRIAEGVASGELTRHETRTLAWKEARVAALEHRLKSDGVLTPAERARLQQELNELNRAIYIQKHDDQSR